jgi:hypothetical protein
MKPAGRLANGKEFFGDAAHPGNKHLDANDHIEAAKQLVGRAKRMMTGNETFHDEFAIQHANRLGQWASTHAKLGHVKMRKPQRLAASERPFSRPRGLRSLLKQGGGNLPNTGIPGMSGNGGSGGYSMGA